jgi:hypothetical protein
LRARPIERWEGGMRAKVLNSVVLVLLGSLIGGGTWAVANGLITGKDIENGSITGRDIKRGSITSREIGNRAIHNRDIRRRVITLNRLTRRVQRLIRRRGPEGPGGAPGLPGQPGGSTPILTSGNFGVIDRAVFGSPVAQLRSGPGDPPSGSGSLGLLVAGGPDYSPPEKIAYGIRESGSLSRLRRVGFAVFTTPANVTRGGPGSNMPNIQFEINPHLSDASGSITFSTLTFNAVNGEAHAWTTIDATDPAAGRWSLTGRAGTATSCATPSATAGCTFEQIKDRLPDATISTLMVNKGRDFEWQGAVDALRINGRIADFEEGGPVIRAR